MRPLSDVIFAACSNPVSLMPSHPTPDGRRKLGEKIKNSMREARRFFVDAEVTQAASYLGVQHPEILLSMLARARAPFKTCWIEWDNHAQVEEAGGPLEEDAPDRAGVLIERLSEDEPLFRMTSIGALADHGNDYRVSVCPISVIYNLDHPIAGLPMSSDRRMIAEISELPEDYVRKTLIGGAYMEHKQFQREPDEIEYRKMLCDQLTDYATNVISPFMAPIIRETLSGSKTYNRDELTRIIRSTVVEHSGTWRFVVSLFALINSQDYVESDRTIRDGKSRMVGGKIVPYLDRYLVKLKLPRKIVQARIIKEMADAIPKRRHEVMGHWRSSRKKGLADCEHVYVNETASRQVCIVENCGHKRWWVNEFERGDASVGYVIKDRLVTKS